MSFGPLRVAWLLHHCVNRSNRSELTSRPRDQTAPDIDEIIAIISLKLLVRTALLLLLDSHAAAAVSRCGGIYCDVYVILSQLTKFPII